MDEYYSLYGILYGCPFNERLNECPLIEFDRFSFQDKMHIFNALTKEEKQDVLNKHNVCLKKREKHRDILF